MKVVILAGGFGTRISEESHLRPKPMIEIGNMPILWHIMKLYSHYGFNDFIICAGYKQYVIKEYFSNYFLHKSDITFDFTTGHNDMIIHDNIVEPWKVTVVDTGLTTMTGGRIKRIGKYLNNEAFMVTYGDGVSDVDISQLVDFHKKHNKIMTLTGIQPEGRFGVMDFVGDDIVAAFREKNKADSGWINGGFIVCQPEVLDYIEGDDTSFEQEPMERLAKEGQLACYRHHGFWQCMDTLRDKDKLEKLWAEDTAPWKVWK
ncbi:MAG: glucose-1-phosphate cytidylyltransferase [Blautia sp.]|nr:glucose-1-phosphate cytidylyltransferase [Lachnoclostridium sp.]MCM1212181.1 glucose-1-phosphate cytidylyltransferase [Blautia sp.]